MTTCLTYLIRTYLSLKIRTTNCSRSQTKGISQPFEEVKRLARKDSSGTFESRSSDTMILETSFMVLTFRLDYPPIWQPALSPPAKSTKKPINFLGNAKILNKESLLQFSYKNCSGGTSTPSGVSGTATKSFTSMASTTESTMDGRQTWKWSSVGEKGELACQLLMR